MRVISGIFKGKKLYSPKGNKVRPTTDRIKETVFNILCARNIVDSVPVLDLFCGSGAIGIEALSRGAISAVFVDNDSESLSLTRKNLAHVAADPAAYELHCTDYRIALKKCAGRKFGLIFLDPPFDCGFEQICLATVITQNILSNNGVIVFEHSDKISLQKPADDYIIETRNYGIVHVSFISRKI